MRLVWKLGAEIANNTPTIATTTTSSSRVVPAAPDFLKLGCMGLYGAVSFDGRPRTADLVVHADLSPRHPVGTAVGQYDLLGINASFSQRYENPGDVCTKERKARTSPLSSPRLRSNSSELPKCRNSESSLSLLTAFEKGKLREYTASYSSNMPGDQLPPRQRTATPVLGGQRSTRSAGVTAPPQESS